MIINHTKTKLTKISDVIVPNSFFNRMKTGVKQLDTIYGGEGILPGSVSTIAAAPGSGKCHAGDQEITIFGSDDLINRLNNFILSRVG
jgi:predicted ATP-dependent serine protease